MRFEDFYVGFERPVPPKVVKPVKVETLDEGDAVQEGWVRGERDDEEFDLDLDG